MRNHAYGAQREDAVRGLVGGSSATLKTPYTYRQVDIFRQADRYMARVKSGPVSLTAENKLAIKKDAWFVREGFEVEHILEGGASTPYLEALERARIGYTLGPISSGRNF